MTGPGNAAETHHGPSDHAIEQFVGRLLQIGVLIAAIVTLIGGAMLVARHGHEVPVYTPFRGQPPELTSLTGIVHAALAGQARAIIQFGLVLLIATPVLRVAFTLVAFVMQRDRTYIVVTAIVLTLLIYGLVFGRA